MLRVYQAIHNLTDSVIPTVRHRRITEHKSSTGHCTDPEWEAILAATFIKQEPVHEIEIRADILKDSNSISLSFRKNIQGITVSERSQHALSTKLLTPVWVPPQSAKTRLNQNPRAPRR